MIAHQHSRALAITRMFGALMLIATSAVQLQQFFAVYYRVIPVIGPCSRRTSRSVSCLA